MGFNGGQALVAILILTVLALRQLTKSKRRDSESSSRTEDESEEENEALTRDSNSTSRTDDRSGEEYERSVEENKELRRDSESTSTMEEGSGEENKALRRELGSESTSRTEDGLGEEYKESIEENEALRRVSKSTSRTEDGCAEESELLRRELESTSRTNDGSGEEYERSVEENEVLRRESESTSRTKDGCGEENEALRRESKSISRTDDGSGEDYEGSVEENEALKRESESSSRTDDGSGEENEAMRRESESSSRTDDGSGEENEAMMRESESSSRTDDGSGEENEAMRRGSESTLRDSKSTSTTESGSGEEYEGSVGEYETLRRDSESPESSSRTDDGSGEEKEALRRELKSTLRDSESTSTTEGGSGEEYEGSVGEYETLRRDSESPSRTDDGSGEENDALGRDWESTSRMDDASGEEYDVFLSFRGIDTRLNFTDHLYRSMIRVGIRVFLDSEELEIGEKINEVLKAVDESRIYVPIFSKNFASSIWCLREVKHMVDHSKSNGKKEIIPIFYDVKTDDVKLRTALYKNDIIKHQEKVDPDEMEGWQNALKTVGTISGRELQGKRQGEEIDSIVEQVSRKLNTRLMIMKEHVVEDSAQVEAMMKLLGVGSNDIRFVGIHGTGGVGKTTLAKIVFNKLSYHFEGCCFLEDVRASSEPHGGLLKLQKKLLSGFVGSSFTDPIENVDGGIRMIKKVFGNKKVLIVLDDLDEKEQLENLAGKSDWFCRGSRIIITTREKSILRTTQKDHPEGILPYEVLGMRFDLALNLFYKYAFRSESAVEEYEDPSREIVCKVGMLPLAVVVIGSHLFDLSNDLGHLDKREVWDETLKQLKQGPFDKVRKSLIISYKRLADKEKEVFLDIACFFTNDDITYPFIMWKDCDYYPATAMRVLSNKSLVKIRDDDRFWMHDQVRDFGRYIVLEEYPRKFCRVWTREKAVDLLKRKERNEEVEALSLIFDGHSFTRQDLACLPKLRFLRVKESEFFGDFKNLLSELRWLSWQTRQTTFHANDFHFNNLVVLDLSDSYIGDDWGGWSQMKVIGKLKVLDLTGCTKLTRTPNFSNFMSLEMLILARCPKLITIDCSIGKLELLKTLNVRGCSSLKEFPEEVGSLHSLTEIVMPQNFQPFKLPERFGELKSLSSFIFDEHSQTSQLPKSIGGLVKLTHLSLRGCVGIKELPSSIGELSKLVELDISKSGIVTLPNSIGNLKELRVMRIGYTAITKFPYTIGEVVMLEELHAKKCWSLSDEYLEEIGKLSHLRILDLSYTRISSFPEVICGLSYLEKLQVGSIKLRELTAFPSSLTCLEVQAVDFSIIPDLSRIINLDYLELFRLSNFLRKEPYSNWRNDVRIMQEAWSKEQPIQRLPSRLSTLKLKGIGTLPRFSDLQSLTVLHVSEFSNQQFPVCDLVHLKELNLSRGEYLDQIPGLSHLKSLRRLVLYSLNRLVKIPGLSELKRLQYLRLSRCHSIEGLPNLSKLDKLQHLELESCPHLRQIEGVEGLESWKLDSDGRIVLERLLNVSRTTWVCRKLLIYDVFLSFRGPDTRYSIIRFLNDSLIHDRISFFKDDDELSPGEGIGEEIQRALDNSHIYIPVFSKNYASSQWCLRELATMLKCTSESRGQRRIIPIFYDVKIEDVQLKSDLYKKDLRKHTEFFYEDEVWAWETALKEVGYIEGFDLGTNSPEEVVQKVIAEVLKAKELYEK